MCVIHGQPDMYDFLVEFCAGEPHAAGAHTHSGKSGTRPACRHAPAQGGPSGAGPLLCCALCDPGSTPARGSLAHAPMRPRRTLAASDEVRNYAGLTPLVLAAQLGDTDMFQHIYNRRRRAFYTFGTVRRDASWGCGAGADGAGPGARLTGQDEAQLRAPRWGPSTCPEQPLPRPCYHNAPAR